MTLSSSHQSPSDAADTPTPDPYRLATSAVQIPREPTTAELATIRGEIEPRTAFWQFEFQPWHYWTAIGTTAVVTIAFVALIATLGAIR